MFDRSERPAGALAQSLMARPDWMISQHLDQLDREIRTLGCLTLSRKAWKPCTIETLDRTIVLRSVEDLETAMLAQADDDHARGIDRTLRVVTKAEAISEKRIDGVVITARKIDDFFPAPPMRTNLRLTRCSDDWQVSHIVVRVSAESWAFTSPFLADR
ncbi:hypothetical protein [Sagittula stellata]|nr:hypothetical protein [Sagittula stellata]